MKKYLFLLATAMLACSCGDDDNTIDDPQGPVDPPAEEETLSLSASEHLFSNEEGAFEITVTSSGDWEVIGGGNGFTVAPKEGKNGDKATVSVTANPAAESRSCDFTFICGEETAVFKATQAGGEELTIATTSYTAPITGGTIRIEVQASGAYTYEVENAEQNTWLHKPAAASPDTTSAELVADANDTGKARTATVIFALGDLTVPVTVSQAQNDVLQVIEGAELSLSFDMEPAGSQEFSFVANFKPNVSADASWITVTEPVAESAEEGPVTYKMTISAEANDGAPRTGKVTVSADESKGLAPIEIAVAQDGETPLPEGWVRIPDANFRAKLLSLGWIVSADDTACEITETGKTGTSLVMGNSGITDLTGIAAFPAVTTLNVFNNAGITSLDLSKNPNITNLNVNNDIYLSYLNLGTAKLGWLDVKNIAAESLTIIAEGAAGDIELSGTMTTIALSGKGINKLNINSCTKVAEVDLRNCPALTKVNVNNCMELKKVILPKALEGTFQPTNGANINAEFQYVWE